MLSSRAIAHQAALARAIQQTEEEIWTGSPPPTEIARTYVGVVPVVVGVRPEPRRARLDRLQRRTFLQQQAIDVLRLQEVLQVARGIQQKSKRIPLCRARIPKTLINEEDLRTSGAATTLNPKGVPGYVVEAPAAWLVFKGKPETWTVFAIPYAGPYTHWDEAFQKPQAQPVSSAG